MDKKIGRVKVEQQNHQEKDITSATEYKKLGRPKGSKNKSKSNGLDTLKKLNNLIYNKYSEFKNFENNEFCIIDRINSFNYSDIIKESLYAYNNTNSIICERFYFKNKCKAKTIKVPKIKDENRKILEEFNEFAKSLDITSSDKDKLEKDNEKIKEFQEKLNNISESDVSNKKILMYENIYTMDYMLVELKKAPAKMLKTLSLITASFIFNYFNTTRIVNRDQYVITMRSINYDDYVDVIAILE